MNKQIRTDHLSALDGMRGIAAIAVVLHHACQITNWGSNFAYAHLAVDFFFTLSGLVVAMAYEEKLKQSVLSFPRFVIIRLIRLYPMILIGTLLGAVVLTIRLLTTHTLTISELLLVLFSALAIMPTTALVSLYPIIYPANTPEWSLLFELAINFVYAPLVRWLTNKKLILICILSCAALYWVALQNEGLDVGFTEDNFLYGFLRVLFPFVVGILLFRYRPSFRVSGWIALPLALLLMTVLFTPQLEYNAPFELMAVVVIFPLIVFLGSICRNNTFLTPLWLVLGELSYPLYLVHHPLIRIISNGITILHFNLSANCILLLSVTGAVIGAYGTLVIWDRPVRRWLGRRIGL